MGKAMQKLNELRNEREMRCRMEELTNKLFGSVIDHNSLARQLYELNYTHEMEYLDQQIKLAEKEAFEEQAREVREATLNEISDAGKQAGKQLAQAIQDGFNSIK